MDRRIERSSLPGLPTLRELLGERVSQIYEGASLVDGDAQGPTGVDMIIAGDGGRPVFVDIVLERPLEGPTLIFDHLDWFDRNRKLFLKAYAAEGVSDAAVPAFVFVAGEFPTGVVSAVGAMEGVDTRLIRVEYVLVDGAGEILLEDVTSTRGTRAAPIVMKPRLGGDDEGGSTSDGGGSRDAVETGRVLVSEPVLATGDETAVGRASTPLAPRIGDAAGSALPSDEAPVPAVSGSEGADEPHEPRHTEERGAESQEPPHAEERAAESQEPPQIEERADEPQEPPHRERRAAEPEAELDGPGEPLGDPADLLESERVRSFLSLLRAGVDGLDSRIVELEEDGTLVFELVGEPLARVAVSPGSFTVTTGDRKENPVVVTDRVSLERALNSVVSYFVREDRPHEPAEERPATGTGLSEEERSELGKIWDGSITAGDAG